MTDPINAAIDRLLRSLESAERRHRAMIPVAAYLGLCLGVVLVDVLDLNPVTFIVFSGVGYFINVAVALRK